MQTQLIYEYFWRFAITYLYATSILASCNITNVHAHPVTLNQSNRINVRRLWGYSHRCSMRQVWHRNGLIPKMKSIRLRQLQHASAFDIKNEVETCFSYDGIFLSCALPIISRFFSLWGLLLNPLFISSHSYYVLFSIFLHNTFDLFNKAIEFCTLEVRINFLRYK